MGVEAKLAPQFTGFNPGSLAEVETSALFYDDIGQHDSAFHCQLALVIHQFGLSPEAAGRVLDHIRPDKNMPPKREGLPGYWQQISQETGLNFSVNPSLLIGETTVKSLAGIYSAVYGVEPEKLYSAMESRLAAIKSLDRNVTEMAGYYYHENLLDYYTKLKEAIS